jgi:biotin-(acetyl-CoA carboxylase) ligase
LRVRLNGEETDGSYAGLDSDGALRLKTTDGEKRITAGDVFFASR